MQALPSGSTLTLWEYERFGLEESTILQNLVGHEAQEDLGSLHETPRSGPSLEGIEALDKIAAAGEPPEIETIRRTLRKFGKDKGFAGYSPWTMSEKETFEQRYARDLELIRCLWPKALISQAVPAPITGTVQLQQHRQDPESPKFPTTNLQKRVSYRRPAVNQY